MAERRDNFSEHRQGKQQSGYRFGGGIDALFLHVGAYSVGVPETGTHYTTYGVRNRTGWTGWKRVCNEQDHEREGTEE